MNCIAIDLHTDNILVARRKMIDDKADKITAKYNLDPVSLKAFTKTLSKEDYVAVESTLNSFWFYDTIAPFVKKVIIFDTTKINYSGNKTDKIDAKKLLDTLEFYVYIKGENEIPTVYIPKMEIRQIRELFSTYKLQKKIIIQLKNRIHSIFKQHGLCIKKKSFDYKPGKDFIRALEINDISKYQVHLLLKQLEESEKLNKETSDMIIFVTNTYFQKEIDLLLTIPGFSPLSAAALISDIADISRFPSVRKYCSYLRTAPKIKESNRTTHIGKVSKCSRKLTVTFLTQSVTHFKKSSPYFNDFYTRLKAGKSYGKTRMALIRKILVCSYYMLKREEEFKWNKTLNVKEKRNQLKIIVNRGGKKMKLIA